MSYWISNENSFSEDIERKEKFFLIVEDSPPNLRIISNLISKNGYGVIECEDGKTAQKAFLENRDKIIGVISDIYLPGLSGLEFLRFIRDHDLKLPFFIVTGEPETENIVEAGKFHVDAFIVKPLRSRTIAEKLNQVYPGYFHLPVLF